MLEAGYFLKFLAFPKRNKCIDELLHVFLLHIKEACNKMSCYIAAHVRPLPINVAISSGSNAIPGCANEGLAAFHTKHGYLIILVYHTYHP